MRNVGWAGFCVLLINPHAVLSFAAVVGFFEAVAILRDISRILAQYYSGARLCVRPAAHQLACRWCYRRAGACPFQSNGEIRTCRQFDCHAHIRVNGHARFCVCDRNEPRVMGKGLDWILLGAGQLVEAATRCFGRGVTYVDDRNLALSSAKPRPMVRSRGHGFCCPVAGSPAGSGCSHSRRGLSTGLANPVGRYGRDA